jgi:ribosomal protein S12 methylthiotransferase
VEEERNMCEENNVEIITNFKDIKSVEKKEVKVIDESKIKRSILVFVETLGCAKNQVDSEVMIGLLNENAYFITADASQADVIVVNTCGFIESAKEESIDTILEMTGYKDDGNCKVLVVTGCLAQRYAEELKNEIPQVDVFIGTGSFDEIIPVLDRALHKEEIIIQKGDINKDFSESLPRVLSTPSYMAYLKIAEGCDNHCTYCIIPKLRGKYRSRKFEDVVIEAKKLVEGGVKELIIIAQDITRYGIDLYDKYRLADLIRELNKIEGLEWIRLQYCYPDVVDDELIDAIAECEKVAKYIDIPIQHCNDDMLKLMNRATSKADIVSLLNKLREKVSDISIRTTLIVGFPGETDKEFDELLEFVKEYKFDKLGVFTYSKEEDTAAVNLPGHIDEDVKIERKNAILEAQMYVSTENLMKFMGKDVRVLIEELIEGEDMYIARAEFDAPEIDGVVYVKTNEKLSVGDFVTVKIIDTMEYDLIGEM